MSLEIGGSNKVPQRPNENQTSQPIVKKDVETIAKRKERIDRRKDFTTIDASVMDATQTELKEQTGKINDIATKILSIRQDVLEEKSLTPAQKESLQHIQKDIDTFVKSHESLKSELKEIEHQLGSPQELKRGDSLRILQKQVELQGKIQDLQSQGEKIVANPRVELLKDVQREINQAGHRYDVLMSNYEKKQTDLMKERKKMGAEPQIEKLFNELKDEISLLETTKNSVKEANVEKETARPYVQERHERIELLANTIQSFIDNSTTKKLSPSTVLQNSVRGFFSSKAATWLPNPSYAPDRSSELRGDSVQVQVGARAAKILGEMTKTEKTFSEQLEKGVNLLEKMSQDKKIYRSTRANKKVTHLHAMHVRAHNLAKQLSSELESVAENKTLTDAEKALKIGEIYRSDLFRNYVDILKVCVTDFNSAENSRLVEKFLKGKDITSEERQAFEGINAQLITTAQRMPRHRLLLEDLLKEVPAGSEAYKELSLSLNYVKGVTTVINSLIPKM